MASGDTLLIFTPLHNEPPAAGYATLDIRNQHPVLDFDAADDESAVFSGILPRHYAGGGITVYIHVAFSSATSGNSVWNISFERIGDEVLDIDGDSFAGVEEINVAPPGTCGEVAIESVNFTDGAEIDSLAVGEGLRLKITRDADNIDDDAVGDAELLFVELKET